jgi:NAD(P)-dependent dehydrogenase (short-subunit alcohol dehydrogenase family)
MKIQGGVFVVTGGASGLGQGTVREIVALGGKVSILDRDPEKAAALIKELGPNVHFAEMDCTEEESIKKAVAAVIEHWGRIDGCINCAGVASATSTIDRKGEAHDMETFAFVVKLNLLGTFSVSAKCAAQMAKQEAGEDGEKGCIINVASVAAFDGQNGQASYAASKAGVVGMSLPMARDLGRHGIRVNVIAPGIMSTPMTDVMPEKLLTSLAKSQVFPNTRLGTSKDFAQLAVFILQNRFLNAECIRLDAGVRMQKL